MTSRLVCGAAAAALALGFRPTSQESPSARPTPRSPAVAVAALVPPTASLGGWRVAEGPLAFRPDTLYEYIDGGAPRYLDYGFREAVHVRYALGGDPQATVTLDIYDMGSALGAFGIYSSARPRGVAPRGWGAEGYRFETVAAAWKGQVYVHVQADDERPALAWGSGTVVAAGRFVAGIHGDLPGEARRRLLEGLVAGLLPPAP